MYDYKMLKKIVGEFLGYQRADWTAEQEEEINLCVQRGYTQFLYPPPLKDRGKSHQWRFLKPTILIDTEANVGDYDLPHDFERLTGEITYTANNTGIQEISEVSEGQIRDLRGRSATTTTSSYPTMCATRPKPHDGVDTQGWELMLWPTPSGVLTLEAQVAVIPLPLSDDRQVPYGGPHHADTILESCLSIAEQYLEDNAGVHTLKWKERLTASVDADSRTASNKLGYNGNGPMRVSRRRANRTTYKGTLYD